MENRWEPCPQGAGDLENTNLKIGEEDDPQTPNHSVERMDFGSEPEDGRQAGCSEEQAEGSAAGCAGRPPGRGASPEPEDDYGALLAQYGSTLYSVAMEAVTQSLLSGRGLGSRKKSPAWKHFFISPRDSTKAVCTYCMKEFSRGKNEKDLSTSCLMRHVRRAHPTALAGDPAPAPRPAPTDPEGPCPGLSPGPLVPRAASKGSAPVQLKEEASSAVSSEEAASDALASERHGRNEPPPGQPPHTPPLHCLEPAENGVEKNPPLPRSACGSRRRSAVWKHFYLSPLDSSKAVCIHCMNEFSRGKNGKDLGTSCLIRHMWRAHRAIVLRESGGGPGAQPRGPAPPPPGPAPPPPDTEPGPLPASPGRALQDPASAASSPDRPAEEPPAVWGPGGAPSPSSDAGEASWGSSPETQPGGAPSPWPREPGAAFQQNKKVVKRLKSEAWLHFSLAPADSLKAVCRHCGCAVSRGGRGDVGTSCLLRHLCRRHPGVFGGQKGLLGAGSPCATLASAEASSWLTDLPTTVAKNRQAVFPVNSKKTSKLWNHFSICSTDPTKVACLHCGRTISRGKKPTNLGTSCLLRHLQRFHSGVLKPEGAWAAPPSPPGTPAPLGPPSAAAATSDAGSEKLYESHPVAKKITSLIAEMIALDLQPYSLVDNVGFNRLLAYLKPQYSLPPPAYFSRTAIPDMYEDVKHVIMAHLQEAESGVVHFTSGIWMSSQTREYLTLTAHWVTFEPSARPHCEDRHCSALLDVSQVDCDCSSSSIREQLECWWEAWVTSSGLQVGITVTDNPSIGKTLNEGARSSVPCFSHTVNLIVSEAIKSQRMVQNLLSTARKICERVQRSPRAKAKLAELQREYGLPPHHLLQDVPSKWSTSFHMLERLLEQKRVVNALSVECDFRELLSCDQWEVMQSVCRALTPFAAASQEMSAHVSTLSQVIPMIHILSRRVEMLFQETTGIDAMLRALREAMVSRLSATLHDPRFVLATLLDPRYKASLFSEEEAEQSKQRLIRELETLDPTSEPAPVPNGCGPGSPPRDCAGEESLWALMAKLKKSERGGRPKAPEDVVLAYLEEEVLEHSCDPLAYWSLKRAAWPSLSALAVRFLGCPPSIVPSERLFSTPPENGSFGQSRLLMEHFEKLIFLKVNLPLICFQY